MNKKNPLLLIISILCLNLGLGQTNEVDEIEKHMVALSADEMQGRETGSFGLEKCANYISDYFKSEGIKPYYKTYKDTFYLKDKRVAYNLIAKIEGKDPTYERFPVIIGAHYDHIGYKKAIKGDSIANGANDNASGTVAVMHLAKLLKASEPLRPILFVLFDAEEQGLLGSKYLAEKMKSEDLQPYLVFNIEMIGVPMIENAKKAYLTGFNKSNFAEVFNSYLPEKALIFSKQAQKFGLFKRSDNYPFFETFSIPSHSVSSFDFTNYDYYHHVGDQAEQLDYKHMYHLISSWAEALIAIAKHEENLIKLND